MRYYSQHVWRDGERRQILASLIAICTLAADMGYFSDSDYRRHMQTGADGVFMVRAEQVRRDVSGATFRKVRWATPIARARRGAPASVPRVLR